MKGWECATVWGRGTRLTGGLSLPYHLDINLLDGYGSADIMEHLRPSKVSIRSAAEGTEFDRLDLRQ